MLGYLGSFQHQIDEKGRLSLPAPFRREKGEQTLVLVHVFPDSLTLYPEDTWAEVEARLREAMRGSASARAWALRVTANALEVTPDKQGRILVPQRMQDAVGIQGPTLVVGALNKIELWDPARFEAATRAAEQPENITNQIFA
ncbi:MAG TPA: division/cell wall cluster transcriptional repressor MraZ [Longimicrobiaceae bacterium]|nr:division/cell wall cluster transcriptional repressor MraZ [Longimicrobiaceae bacterium]